MPGVESGQAAVEAMTERGERAVDVLIVSLGATRGLRAADDELSGSLQRAGASVALVRPVRPADVRTLMLTDLRWARAARSAMLAELTRTRPRAVLYSSITSALLWPRPGAIRFDAPAAGNRPGRHGLWQRPLERRRLGGAPLLLPWSAGGLGEAPRAVRRSDRVLVLPVAVEPSRWEPGPGADRSSPGPETGVRDIAALAYAANPLKKGLDRVLEAWRRVRRPSEELVVAGVEPGELRRLGFAIGADGVHVTGMLGPDEYRTLLRRARVFVCAPRREDYGIAQLEALADGCRLVSTPAPGPYAALALARKLDPRLVSEDLGAALRAALDDPVADYSASARQALAPFRRDAVDRLVARELLPRLLASG